jgi:transposase-like protein
VLYVICPECKKTDFVNHSPTKAGSLRFKCKVCGKVITPEKKKRRNDNPSCPNAKCENYGKNSAVQKHYFTEEKKHRRYICKMCGATFMSLEDYKPTKINKNKIIATWLNLRDNEEWKKIKSEFSEDNKNHTKIGYICKHYKISRSTLSRYIKEYEEEHPEEFLQKEDRNKITAKLEKRYNRLINVPDEPSDTTPFDTKLKPRKIKKEHRQATTTEDINRKIIDELFEFESEEKGE